jgi:Tol biopolymer transport system component
MLSVRAADVRLRAEPAIDAEALAAVLAGATIPLIGEPVRADGLSWYQTRFAGTDGWITSGEDGEWLSVVRNGRIAFSCRTCNDGGPGTLSVAPNGDDAQVLFGEYGVAHWAPDGSRLVIQYGDGVRLLPSLVMLTPDGTEEFSTVGSGVAWSPDGERIAYIDPNDRTLFISDLTGDRTGFEVSDLGGAEALAWSPDSTRIAFTAIDCPDCPVGEPFVGDPPISVFMFEPPGGAVVKVADGGNMGSLRWSPDGSALSFLELDLGGGDIELRVVTFPDGSVTTHMARGLITYGHDFSPDGTRLVGGTEHGIVVTNADGSDQQLVYATRPGDVVPTAPRWSPDGQWILFERASIESDAVETWIVRADGTDARQVAAEGFGADWQPVLEPLPAP